MNTPETVLKNIYNKISKYDVFVFIVSFVSCFFTHLFSYTNILSVHDATQIHIDSTGIENGRFFISLLYPLIQRINVPVIIGLLTCLFMALAVVLINKIFSIESKFFSVLLSAVVISHPTIVAAHYYFTSAYVYAFALLMSVIAVCVIDKHKIWGPIAAVIAMIISLGSYQAYIELFLCLLIIKLIIDCSNSEKTLNVIANGIKYVITACVSMGLYYGIWKAILAITKTEMVDYRNYSNLEASITENFIENIINTFTEGFELFINNYFNLSPLFFEFYLLCCVAALGTAIYISCKNKSKSVFLQPILYFFLFFAYVFILMLSPGDFHILMAFGTVAPFILLIKNLEIICKESKLNLVKSAIVWLLVIYIALTSTNQIVLANVFYTEMSCNYNYSLSYCTRLVDRIEQTDGFKKSSKVVLIGKTPSGISYSYTANKFWPNYVNAFVNSECGLSYIDTVVWFIQQNMVTDMNISFDWDTSIKYFQTDEGQKLSPFPAKNCMMWDDDVLVVRLT